MGSLQEEVKQNDKDTTQELQSASIQIISDRTPPKETATPRPMIAPPRRTKTTNRRSKSATRGSPDSRTKIVENAKSIEKPHAEMDEPRR